MVHKGQSQWKCTKSNLWYNYTHIHDVHAHVQADELPSTCIQNWPYPSQESNSSCSKSLTQCQCSHYTCTCTRPRQAPMYSCSSFQGVDVEASIQSCIPAKHPCGPNRKSCLGAHGRLPRTLRYYTIRIIDTGTGMIKNSPLDAVLFLVVS